MSARVVPFSEAMTNLVLGYETSLGRVKASPFLYEPEKKTSLFHSNNQQEDGPPQTGIQYKLQFIESRSDLADNLNISGKFSLRRANISGSIGGSYLDRELRTDSNVYLLITVEVTHSITMIAADPEIDPRMVPGLPGAIEQEDFLELYGDSFVSAIEIGGRLDGLVEITASDEDDKTEIKATGKAEVKGVASGQISLNYLVSKLTKNRQSRVIVNGVGGGIGLSPMDAPSFVKLAREFPAMVNGGEAETIQFETRRVETETEAVDIKDEENVKERVEQIVSRDQEEDRQLIIKNSIKFPGIAVPVRAVVRTYKSLPIFSYSPSVLTRLSSYVTDDLIDYYLTYDQAKNTIGDMMQNANAIFNVTELEKLGDIRKEVRVTQVKALDAIDKAATAKDIVAAKDAAESLAELTPGEVFLRRAMSVEDDASVRIAEETREKQVAEQIAESKKDAVLAAFRKLGDETIQIGLRDIQSGDVLALLARPIERKAIGIRTTQVVTSRGVYVALEDETKLFAWDSDDMRTMSDIARVVKIEDNENGTVNTELRARDVRLSQVVYNAMQRQIAAQYADVFGSAPPVPLEYLNKAWRLRNFRSDQNKWSAYIQNELRSGNTDIVAGSGAGVRPVLNTIAVRPDDTTPNETFTFEVEDAEKRIVSLRVGAGGSRYLQHVLQVGKYGVVAVGTRTDDEQYESFLFKLVPIPTAAGLMRIETDAGRYSRYLFVDQTTRTLFSAPQTELFATPKLLDASTFITSDS